MAFIPLRFKAAVAAIAGSAASPGALRRTGAEIDAKQAVGTLENRIAASEPNRHTS
jgi:hypothetical protein